MGDLSSIPEISRDDLKKVLVIGSGLHKFHGSGDRGIKSLICAFGAIQLDPLNPAGRNHDLFCFSRLKSYTLGRFEQVTYPNALVFENYFQTLKIISADYFSLFYPYRTYENLGPYYKKRIDHIRLAQPKLLDNVLAFIRENGPVTSADLAHFGKATPDMKIWKSSTKAGNALEFLWVLGKIAVTGRDGQFKKRYDLIERHFSQKMLSAGTLAPGELAYRRLQLRLQSFPVINAKFTVSQDNGYKLPRSKKNWVHQIHKPLGEILASKTPAKAHEIVPKLVYCPETQRVYFIRHDYREILQEEIDGHMRAIGPLDPVIYDRDQTKDLFGFDYVWEVYKPVKDRRWGYYHYPILWKGEFIGRVEAKITKGSDSLKLFNFHREKPPKNTAEFKRALGSLIIRWQSMLGAQEVVYDDTIPI